MKSVPELQEDLAKFSFLNAKHLCKPEHGCYEYHKVWSTLRLLKNPGALPSESDFFERSIKGFAKTTPIRILISGAADTGLAAMVLKALSAGSASGEILVVDQCPTVIAQHRLYKELGGVDLKLYTGSILDLECDPVDIVIAHNFIRFLPKQDRQALFNKWSDLLADDGLILLFSNTRSSQEEDGSLDYQAPESTIRNRVDELGKKARQCAWLSSLQKEFVDALRLFIERQPGEADTLDEILFYIRNAGLSVREVVVPGAHVSLSPRALRHGSVQKPKVLITAAKAV